MAAIGGQFGAVAQTEGVVDSIENEAEKVLQHRRQSSETNVSDQVEDSDLSVKEKESRVRDLVRSFTQQSIRLPNGDHVNPFSGTKDPLLDPSSGSFSNRAWVKTLLGITSRDPERYPKRVAGVSYKNLNVHGFGTPTDYQKTFGNMPLELFSLVNKITGKGKTKIQILRDFDGLVKSGEMLVVLGRPGR